MASILFSRLVSPPDGGGGGGGGGGGERVEEIGGGGGGRGETGSNNNARRPRRGGGLGGAITNALPFATRLLGGSPSTTSDHILQKMVDMLDEAISQSRITAGIIAIERAALTLKAIEEIKDKKRKRRGEHLGINNNNNDDDDDDDVILDNVRKFAFEQMTDNVEAIRPVQKRRRLDIIAGNEPTLFERTYGMTEQEADAEDEEIRQQAEDDAVTVVEEEEDDKE